MSALRAQPQSRISVAEDSDPIAAAALPDTARGNLVLDRLTGEDWAALQPLLELVQLSTGDRLTGDAAQIHFPMSGLISVSACGGRGKAIEVALVGREGVVGLETMLGERHAADLESVVHFPGTAWQVSVRALQPLVGALPGLRAELLAAVHALIGQMAQSAASIGSGTIEQRLARRLLMASLRLASRDLALTHEAMAQAMAVRRSGITVALHKLEAQHIIRSRRNRVEILDYEGLRHLAGGEGVSRREPGALPSR
jgi:CRP-like cAMP-binding protein